ncbi:Rv0361 family membrane protein [Streptomyces spongiae]|uniref:Uncharacterized protein n=1 Tax=Streptomyces spongiae TaxID=565072 RepID=A0A5N8XK17_9ACTN|nr:hypothetical protein [Streptomyces spongiae]MPY59338.1 hypothetical protein [Streptomyces spongiae]
MSGTWAFGPPGGQAPATPPPPTGHGSKRVWIIISAVAAGLLLFSASVYLVVRFTTDGSKSPVATDESRIRKLVEDFAVAVDRDQQSVVLRLLCTAEAEALREDDSFDPSEPRPTDSPSVRPVKVAGIRVDGAIASARVTRPSQPAVTLYFRKEKGTWKVCAPAADTAAPSASASPSDAR